VETATPENVDKWRKAGRIAAQALQYGAKLIKKGASMHEVCAATDEHIVKLGALPAWPTQIGCNEVAAHSTPDPDDKSVFESQIVCLDVGAHIDGCIGDNALTVDLSGQYADLVKAAKGAFEAARKVVAVGAKVADISAAIQDTITSAGFSPVRNLSGHTISPYVIHDAPTIPNVKTNLKTELVKGQVIAIEPFATDGAGMVDESERSNLFALWNKKPVRSQYAREIMQFVEQNYRNLPFTTRWLSAKFGLGKTNLALRELSQAGCLHGYPPLVEINKGMVAVHENTLLVDDKVEVLTRDE
jgi:methionyl aminopeptidase